MNRSDDARTGARPALGKRQPQVAALHPLDADGGAVPRQSSVYAEEGSLAHAIGARMLKEHLGRDHSGEDEEIAGLRPKYWAPEMETHARGYADFVLSRYRAMAKAAAIPPEILIETRLDYSDWVPFGFGTGDTVIIGDGALEIVDLKYGKGVKVEAMRNPQMMIYALSALHMWDAWYAPGSVTMTIYQPRLGHISQWQTDADSLDKWADEVLTPKAELAWLGKGVPTAGAWCRFCKAKTVCPTHGRTGFGEMALEL